jgi:ABC-type transport system substrate-binding protein
VGSRRLELEGLYRCWALHGAVDGGRSKQRRTWRREEQLFSEAWLSDDVLRGELAESWEVVDKPLSIVINLRKNVKWQACKGIMEARDFTAKDVVFAYNRLVASPKANKVFFPSSTGPRRRDRTR